VLSTAERRNLAQAVSELHNANGGATVNPLKGDLIGRDLWAVSIYPERSQVIHGQQVTSEQVADYIIANADLLAHPAVSLGTWYDATTGDTWLDCSVTVPSFGLAELLASAYNQKAVFSLRSLETAQVGGTGEAVGELPSPIERLASERIVAMLMIA
jgi:hypothetical protein